MNDGDEEYDGLQMSLHDALLSIETQLRIKAPLGASELSLRKRFLAVLLELKQRLCPHKDDLISKIESDGVDLVAVITDSLISSLALLPIPAVTVAKKIAKIGLERFCRDPGEIFSAGS